MLFKFNKCFPWFSETSRGTTDVMLRQPHNPSTVHKWSLCLFLSPLGTRWVSVSGQARLWGRGRCQSPLHLWEHRRWQIPHSQSHPVWWGDCVLYFKVSQLLYGGCMGRLWPKPQPCRLGYRGPAGGRSKSEPENAAAAEGNFKCLLVGFVCMNQQLDMFTQKRCFISLCKFTALQFSCLTCN